MTRILEINDNNDISLNNDNRVAVREGQTAILQRVENAVQLNIGEAPLARTEGVNYFGTVFNDSPNVPALEANIQNIILALPQVVSINSFSSDLRSESGLTTRDRLDYTAEITTDLGPGTISISMGAPN